MKILSKMNNDVTYSIGKEAFTLLKGQVCELDSRIADHPVFKLHQKNGAVEVLGDKNPAKNDDEKANAEKLRQELLQQCKDKGISVNPNTGIAKLKAKLEESK